MRLRKRPPSLSLAPSKDSEAGARNHTTNADKWIIELVHDLHWNICHHETFKVVSCYHELTPRTVRQKQEIIKPRMTNGSSELFAISDHEFAELLWEDGQIVIQSQFTIFFPKASSSDPHELKLGSALKHLRGGGSVEFSNNICAEDALGKNTVNFTNMPDNLPSSNFAARVVLCRNDKRKAPEAASSSVCSVNLTRAALNEPKYGEKRNDDGEELDYPIHSKDLQEESVDMRKPSTGCSAQTKRSRAAEVHNLF